MADRPFLLGEDVARIGGVKPETISTYRQRSKQGGMYEKDPLPEPDGFYGKVPWWGANREQEIRDWFTRLRNRNGAGGRITKYAISQCIIAVAEDGPWKLIEDHALRQFVGEYVADACRTIAEAAKLEEARQRAADLAPDTLRTSLPG